MIKMRIYMYSKVTGEVMETEATRVGVKTLFRILGSFKRHGVDTSHYQFAGIRENELGMKFKETRLSQYMNSRKERM
jgi:hypothetical protein